MSGAELRCRCGHRQTFRVGEMPAADAARAMGWRIWAGETLGGKASEITLCPACAGTATPEQRSAIQDWDAECNTCGASMREDDGGEGPWTEKDARAWDLDHQCEPDVTVIKPGDRAQAVTR